MVEHHIDVVTGLAERIAVMHHGSLLAVDTPENVMRNATVQQAYVGEPLLVSRACSDAPSDLHVHLGGSHVLQGVSLRRSTRAGHGAARPQRRRQDDDAARVLGLVPRQGSIRLGGEPIDREQTHRIVARGLGYVPEDRDVFAGLTVEENLRLAVRNGGARYELVHELFPELRERAAQRAGTLSGGQQQMVAIARALLNPNRLLLIDEPTKGLAPALVADVARVLERVAETETALLVEQNLGVVRRLARTIVVLDQGRVVHTGTAADLDDEALVHRLLGVGHAP